MVNPKLSLLDLYKKAAIGEDDNLTIELWNKIPTSYQQATELARKKRQQLNFSKYEQTLEEFRRMIINYHKKNGLFTKEVQENLNMLDNGIVAVGHQPLLFGGPVFINSKISLAEWLAKNSSLNCFFTIGDHDFIQNELITARFPQINSPSGLFIKPRIYDSFHEIPVHKLPVPDEEWLINVSNKVMDNLRSMMKKAKVRNDLRLLLIERAEEWSQIIFENSLNSDNFSQWTQKIWGTLFLLRNRLGLSMSPTSLPEYRRLIAPGFEMLLIEENRRKYIKTLNQIHEKLTSMGYTPGLPLRKKNYVPFYLECQKCKLGTRTELYIDEPGKLVGKCPNCSTTYEYEYNPNNPDLSELELFITPRSDSRSVVNSYVLPILLHIGGAGETKYHSSVIPAMKKLGIDPPVFIRSNRYWYNSPWIEATARNPDELLLTNQIYNFYKDFNKASDNQTIHSSLNRMHTYIEEKKSRLLSEVIEKEQLIEEEPKNKKLRQELRELQVFMSLQFGRFEKNQLKQEVSWNWFDLAILTSPSHIIDTFQRQLKMQSYPGHTWFINPGKFT